MRTNTKPIPSHIAAPCSALLDCFNWQVYLIQLDAISNSSEKSYKWRTSRKQCAEYTLTVLVLLISETRGMGTNSQKYKNWRNFKTCSYIKNMWFYSKVTPLAEHLQLSANAPKEGHFSGFHSSEQILATNAPPVAKERNEPINKCAETGWLKENCRAYNSQLLCSIVTRPRNIEHTSRD